LPIARHYRAEDFLVAGSNAEAVKWLDHTPAWPLRRLALWGPEGCGKTHLLHLWAARQGAVFLSGLQLVNRRPEGPVAVDDADMAPEQPLLHFLNTAGESGFSVLLAARAPPARWNPSLPDLASRLRAITAVCIGPAEDGLLRGLLTRLLMERQLIVAEALQEWLLLHLPRSQGAVREAVARLDHAAMSVGGRVTRALTQAVVSWLDQEASVQLPQDDGSAQAATEAETIL
jgi:chromosomal replication initiation ATPase DnaA